MAKQSKNVSVGAIDPGPADGAAPAPDNAAELGAAAAALKDASAASSVPVNINVVDLDDAVDEVLEKLRDGIEPLTELHNELSALARAHVAGTGHGVVTPKGGFNIRTPGVYSAKRHAQLEKLAQVIAECRNGMIANLSD